MHSPRNDRGFVALFSVLIIGAMLLVLMLVMNASVFFARFDGLDAEYKRQSLALAESCAQVAALRLLEDSAYAGGETVAIDPSNAALSCMICPFAAGATPTMHVRANYRGAYTDLAVTVSVQNGAVDVLSWQETANAACFAP